MLTRVDISVQNQLLQATSRRNMVAIAIGVWSLMTTLCGLVTLPGPSLETDFRRIDSSQLIRIPNLPAINYPAATEYDPLMVTSRDGLSSLRLIARVHFPFNTLGFAAPRVTVK